VTTSEAPIGAVPLIAPEADIARRRRRRPASLFAGIAILSIVILLAVLAPLLSSHSPLQQNPSEALLPPSAQHLLGTDQLGRDVWARLLYGGRIDLEVGFLAVVLPFVIGTGIGCAAGYFGGWTDTIAMRTVDVVLAFPFFVLVIAIVFVLGPGTKSIYIAIAVTDWVSYTWIVRGEILSAKRHEFVLAARALGYSRRRIIGRHLLPNVISQAIVYAMSDIVFAILAIVTLGYLGLGVPPPTPEWGSMIADGQEFITTNWQLATIPGIAVVITGLGLSLLGDGLTDLLRPE
jgi:peptide/nickel transport system permease protein